MGLAKSTPGVTIFNTCKNETLNVLEDFPLHIRRVFYQVFLGLFYKAPFRVSAFAFALRVANPRSLQS